METSFFGPILKGKGVRSENGCNDALADDYTGLTFHIGIWEAIGRRLRRNYSWIFVIQLVSYLGKLFIHPTPLATMDDLLVRAAIGPVPGQIVLVAGAFFHLGWLTIALVTLRGQRAVGRARRSKHHDPLPQLASTEH